MDIDDLHPQDDYSHRFFIWHEWIQANGLLTEENVFDYFATSMFYDKQSNNQVLRMQTIFTGQPLVNEAEELKRFTGIEFAVVHAQPPSFFIIQKRERLSPEEVRPLAAYFIVHNRIYQAPDLYTVLSNRLLTTVHSLQSSLDVLRTHRPDFTPRTGFIWPIVESSSASLKKRASTEFSETQDTSKQDLPASTKKQQNFAPLLSAIRTTVAHSTSTFTQRSTESVPPETSREMSRSSPTPARESTPFKSNAGTPGPQSVIPRPSISGTKRKKKRQSSSTLGAT